MIAELSRWFHSCWACTCNFRLAPYICTWDRQISAMRCSFYSIQYGDENYQYWAVPSSFSSSDETTLPRLLSSFPLPTFQHESGKTPDSEMFLMGKFHVAVHRLALIIRSRNEYSKSTVYPTWWQVELWEHCVEWIRLLVLLCTSSKSRTVRPVYSAPHYLSAALCHTNFKTLIAVNPLTLLYSQWSSDCSFSRWNVTVFATVSTGNGFRLKVSISPCD